MSEQRLIDSITATLTEMTAQMLASIPQEGPYEVAVPVFDAFIDRLNQFLAEPPFTRDALISIIAAMASDRAMAEASAQIDVAVEWAMEKENSERRDGQDAPVVTGLADVDLTLQRLRAFQQALRAEDHYPEEGA